MAIMQKISITVAALASLAAVIYKPLSLRVEVLGLNRPLDKIEDIHGEEFRVLPDTLYLEDLHLHEPSGLLFGAIEDRPETRLQWFPPIDKLNTSYSSDRGTIITIETETKTVKKLNLFNFPGPFITHGIDIYSSPDDPNIVYIFAVNHLPNPAFVASNGKIGLAARSQIELFRHRIGSSEAEHLRSIWHPSIRTPNDIYAIDAHSIYITNDHYYRSGLLRGLEDVGFSMTPWSDIIHIHLSSHSPTTNSSTSLTATPALTHIQNPNGLAHGSTPDEILINRAAAGVMHIAAITPSTSEDNDKDTTTFPLPPTLPLQILDTVQVKSCLDNPSYFRDPYADITGRDASGYVLAGLLRGVGFPSGQDPTVVWLVQRTGEKSDGKGEFVHKKIFQDDGKGLSTASTAVIIAIDPAKNEGKKQAWLFVTGPISLNAVSMRIDL